MKNIKNNKLFIILGDKNFQQEKINNILSSFFENDKFDQNIERYQSGKHDWNKIGEQLLTYSLFGTPSFFIVEEADILSSEKNLKDLLSSAKEFYQSGDLEKSFKLIISALQQLNINEKDYQMLQENPSHISKLFDEYADNSEFCIELIKKFSLPEKMPEKNVNTNLESLVLLMPEGHYLIITASNYDKRKKIFKELQKIAVIYEQQTQKKDYFEHKKNVDAYVKEFITKIGKKISIENLIFLQELCYEYKNFEKNLEKLVILTNVNQEISRDDILLAFDDEILIDSKMLGNYIKEKNLEKIITIITNPTQTKQDYIKLIGYLRSLIKNGIILKEFFEEKIIKDYPGFVNYLNHIKENASLIGGSFFQQHPYYLFQCYQTFVNYDKDFLITMYMLLFEIDRDLKSTQKNPVDLLIDFFYQMFNPRK